jgi:group II intron reverse transcriptase/maturase
MKAIERLSVIRHQSEINKNWKHKELFRILRKDDIWIAAYENIKRNKGALTPVITKENLNEISLKRLEKLREKVVNESYQFKALNEIHIPKSDSRKRSLGLPTVNDKIIQEVIRMILEAIYEPCFSKQSFGFRQGLGTHDALEHIESKFCSVDWVIEGGIVGVYPTIDHKQLCKILSDKIKDFRFINLIRKLLKCGILQQGKLTQSNFSVLQKSIVSPILANIYYNELDEWVQKKAKILEQSQTNQRKQNYKQQSYQIFNITEQIKKLNKRSKEYKILLKELKTIKRERAKIATKRVQIEYVRYAYDWMIGISGDKVLARELKAEVTNFVEIRLKQTIHCIKTKITDLRAGKTNFLEYEIYLPRNRKISSSISSGTRTICRTNSQVRFDIPMNSVLKKMEERGYIKKLVKGHRSISKVSYTRLKDILIVKHFTHVWTELANYYSGCTNLAKLQYIHYLLHLSCAMTLSHRHRSSIKKIFANHGETLTVSNGKVKTSFPYRKEWSITKKIWQNKRHFVAPFHIYVNRIS